MNLFFAPGQEFALIERMFPPGRFASDGQGLGDDAFVWRLPGLPHPLVITADASSEGVHFRLDWTSPERALRKALLANLSDINAMGGRPRHAFFNLGARLDWPPAVFDALGAALRALEADHDFVVSGGDTLKTADSAFFSFTVVGEVEGAPLLRSACRPGQRIYVSGTLGGSAAGLDLLLQGPAGAADDPDPASRTSQLVTAHLDPRPPLALGPLLAGLATPAAAIDVSDGLSSELAHLARQSGCALRIRAASLPPHPALAARFSDLDAFGRHAVLHGGEEYQLLFTGTFSDAELSHLETVASITEIGEVTEGEGVWIEENGETAELKAEGFVHGATTDCF